MPVALMIRVLIAIAVVVGLASMVRAQTQPSDENGRFILRKAEDGWFRVDQRTGQASLCRQGSVGFTCELVPDDRNALLDEITRLSEANAMLRAQIAKGGDVPDMPGEPDPANPDDAFKLPSEEEVDQMMSIFRTMVDRFMAMVKDLQQEFGSQQQ